ncbi:hypothetical protein [Pseudokineococcus marinus]|uniref:Uncharacterized protein n=1 Tax=Pseudokineococcus marinus TaxID=351215 RepID=A0A849BFL0_9ACTN|nr:hypothetical protein [Pseudokineococcus marinus]NNH21860.1 hypothetical protein [Pseudokineococcus marinus]
MAKSNEQSWLARLEATFKRIYGPAEVDSASQLDPHAAKRLQGINGDFEVRRDRNGRNYLVARPGAQPPAPQDGTRSDEGDGEPTDHPRR